MSERMPKPGESVAEYRIVRQIGRGGMGAVFEAVHEPSGRRAALKVLHARFSQDPEALARFLTSTMYGLQLSAKGGLDRAALLQIVDVALSALG